MSEQPTPETDGKASPHIGFYSCATVPADFARRLERERDEAIRQRDETNRSSKYSCDYNYEQKLKAERERDEAREALDEEMKFHHRTHAELVQTQCQMQDVIREREASLEAAK